MKIAVFTRYSKTGASSRYRFINYKRLLNSDDNRLDIYYMLGENYFNHVVNNNKRLSKFLFMLFLIPYYYLKRLLQLLLIYKYDIIHIERELLPGFPYVFEKFIKDVLKKKIVYEFDDAIYLNTKPKLKVEKIIAISDHVIVGNQYLSSYVRNYNKEVTVIPTSIDIELYDKISKDNKKNQLEKTVIVWIGTQTTIKYLELLKSALDRLGREFNIELRVICNRELDWMDSSISIKNIQWTLNSYIKELCSGDIGIMPLPDDKWASGKCGFKLIQYMGVSIPFVASPVGINVELAYSEKNGFLACGDEEWYSKIKLLIEDRHLRDIMGSNGHKFVSSYFSIQSNYKLINNIYNSLE